MMGGVNRFTNLCFKETFGKQFSFDLRIMILERGEEIFSEINLVMTLERFVNIFNRIFFFIF